jgi:nitroreductase/NAD-dependent dihydropyrimidine dehydrogenase PreA subunit
MPWEDVQAIFRPEGVHMGIMKSDPKKCTRTRGSSCQLCWDNCPFRAWELVEGEEPHLVQDHNCFSCYNCMVACPRNAISVVETYRVEEGFFKTATLAEAWRMPTKPLDAAGDPDDWNTMEKAVLNRRSVRNFKDKPVPEPLIRRILEAGRFAPSAGNCQPWRFIVLTDKALMEEINEAVWGGLNMVYTMYHDDQMVQQLAAGFEMTQPRVPGTFDPRLAEGGMGSIAKRYGPVLLAAPCVIYILEDERGISAGGINVGIAGENMTLVANSLGLGACWNGFATVVQQVPALAEKLGITPPWKAMSALCIGYPKFKQEGMVPREYRPVTWIRDGAAGPVDE